MAQTFRVPYHYLESTGKYTADFSSPFPVHIKELMDEIYAYNKNQRTDGIYMIHETQAKMLHQLIRLVNGRRVLEIGTYTGYSAIAQAAALPADGKLIALDINAETMAIAQQYVEKAKLSDKVDFRLAPAADSIKALIKEDPDQKFDFIFMDADKEAYIEYYNLIMDNNLLSDQGLIVCDNVLRRGYVIRAAGYEDGPAIGTYDLDHESQYKAIHSFNQYVSKDPRGEAVILPLFDGMTIIRKA